MMTNRRGLMFTIMTFFLAMSLVGLSATFADHGLSTERDANQIISADKVSYAWESVRSNLISAAGIEVSRMDNILIINDTLPREESVENTLDQYGDFVSSEFEDESLRIDFLDRAGNVIDWSQVEELSVTPFGINYTYPNTGKNSLEIFYSNETELDHLERIDLTVTIQDGDFTENSWSPDHECASPGTPPDCLPFRATVEFSNGTEVWDSGEKNIDLGQQSNVQHDVNGGWVRIRVGSTGSSNRILQTDLSSLDINTSARLEFDTNEYNFINDPASLRVHDDITETKADV